MFVLGIDPGLSRLGYGIISTEGKRPVAVAAGVIRTTPGVPIPQRLVELFDDLADLIAEYKPTHGAIEQVFVNHNRQTATSVGRASGVALVAMARTGMDVAEYTPSAVKMAVVGYGNATKEQIQLMVAKRLGLASAPSPADAADALAVALCHVQHAPLRAAIERVS